MARLTHSFNPNVVPVEYDEITRWLQEDPPVRISKLGRRVSNNGIVCHFWCSVSSQGLIRISANEDGSGSSYEYTQAEWLQLCNIIQWAIDTNRNPEFTYWYTNDPDYPEAPNVPNRLFGPNVPAICRAYNEYINNEIGVGALLARLVLRPVNAGNGNLRLGLYTKEYRNYVRNRKVASLYIDLGNGLQDIGSIPTYLNHGSLSNKEIISDWLYKHGYITPQDQLEFELEIDEIKSIHTYRFIGKK